MIYHILNGDGLAGSFKLEGEKIICRECLIDGNVQAESLEGFWQIRSDFIKQSVGDKSYFEKVKSEFDKLNHLESTDEVNLWFGNEAFCQVNMWFILSLIWDKDAIIYRVFSDSGNWSCEFHDLDKCLDSRQKLTNDDIQLGKQLWKAFCSQDFESLKRLSKTSSDNFPDLNEVCQALIEIDTKPMQILRELVEDNEIDFGSLFTQFRAKAGIYGFGDTQFTKLLNKV
ncbi:unnamed protein product [Rotaria sp. Silwood2]|nr:unnamed protein product [Rotaria sp. Silwood2]CAF4643111.1 unnamed protein product [Rotaria sp. Silwood2]